MAVKLRFLLENIGSLRFFMALKQVTLAQCAAMVGGDFCGDPECMLQGVGDVTTAGKGDISFVTKAAMLPAAEKSAASAFILPRSMSPLAKPCIFVDNPVLAITILHHHFLQKEFFAEGIHPTAILGKECQLSEDITLGAYCVLGDRVRLGARVHLYPGVVLGDDVSIGDDCEIFPSVTIYANTTLGARVIVHAGSVIGSDGYGYVTDSKGHHLKRPHVGKVVIEDDVEIGANVCVDRGTFVATRIRRGTKIDNLVQIAHNVEVGEDNLIVALVGIAGSCKLGRHVVLGGNAGLAGHIHLGDNVTVGAKAGITNDVPSGATLIGYPAIPRDRWLRVNAVANRLPDMYKSLKALKKEVALLQELIAKGMEDSE